jgi:hypothetical protein
MTEDNSKKLCFVIGPIGSDGSDERCHADWLLKGIIKPVFEAHFPSYEVQRADEIVAPGSINSQVITRIMDAPLVVADMSMHNANAFYELAIRHMVGLPTIHVIGKEWKIPFDVAPYRAITFSRIDYADIEAARRALRSTVEEVIKPGFQVENPITHARGVAKITEHASDAMRVVLNEIASLKRKLTRTDMTAQAALSNSNIARFQSSSPLQKLMGVPFNPASPPPMITAPSDTPAQEPKMGEIYGLSTSNSTDLPEGGILGGLKELADENGKK